jgi:NhaA family Na+:H+ antiporter
MDKLRQKLASDTFAGMLLVGAALLALLIANSPWREAYHGLADFRFGPEALHLNLSVASWAADGLLAFFFFVIGLELKQEIVTGSLSRPREAAVPMIAAVGGMIVPAALFVLFINVLGDPSAIHGWAIPTATDIAFAVGVLALFGKGLPRALRVFLLTLAVVDDLLAIIIIAVFYSSNLNFAALLAAFGLVGLFACLTRTRWAGWWIFIPVGAVAWALMHASGVHATIAGVLLGLVVPARQIFDESRARAHTYAEVITPVSSGLAVPVFAFFAAGVTVVGTGSLSDVLGQAVFTAVAAGLVLGKVIGVLGTTALVTKLTPLRLPQGIGVRDLLPVGLLCGIGFTVSLLIAELSFPDSEHTAAAKLAILIGSFAAAILGAIMLRHDARQTRTRDMNLDGVDDGDVDLM